MKYIALVLLAAWLLIGCHSSTQTTDFQNGDVIFHTSTSRQSKMIQEVTDSKYSHVGIIFLKDGKRFVFEAVQPVKITPLEKFIGRGVDAKYTVMRYQEELSDDEMTRMYNYASAQLGKDYDLRFEWSEERIYCSELVFKIYESAGIELCDKHTFRDYDLSSESARRAIEKRYNTDINLEEEVVTPEDLFESSAFYEVFDNY